MTVQGSVSTSPHQLRALLVDRDADTRHMYAEFLRLGNYEIEEAEDGREALAKALTARPDVIVTETRLPGINGFDLCRILREDSLTREIPIVVVTGDAFETDMQRARSAGADRVLRKPCLPDALASEIWSVITQPSGLRARLRATPTKASEPPARSAQLLERSRATHRRAMMSHVHDRRETTSPPVESPALVCPTCDQPLKYVKSFVGGVSIRHPEQWDYLECAGGCGTFEYRHRTRTLRRT